MTVAADSAVSAASNATAVSANAIQCSEMFGDKQSYTVSTSNLSSTLQFIALIEELLENRTVLFAEFRAFVGELDSHRLPNPISAIIAVQNSSHTIYRRAFEQMLSHSPVMDINAIHRWATARLARFDEAKENRQKTETATRTTILPMKFNLVSHGSYRLREASNRELTEVMLTHDIEVGETLVTQYHWASVMKDNPYIIPGQDIPHYDWEMHQFGDQTIAVLPNFPITHITWWSALVYANELSKKHNLKPVYDLSQIKFWGGVRGRTPYTGKIETEAEMVLAAANGTLTAMTLNLLPIIRAPDNDIYRAEGYRLLTDAEQIYLRLLAGKHESIEEQFKYNLEGYLRIAWPNESHGYLKNPLALLGPQMIQGRQFYDLWGRVPEMAFDGLSATLPRGVNPLGYQIAQRYQEVHQTHTRWHGLAKTDPVTGSLIFTTNKSRVWGREDGFPNEGGSVIGFRLGRTLHPNKSLKN